MTAVLLGNDADSFIWWAWISRNSDEIWDATVEHLQLTLLTVAIGVVVASILTAIALRFRVAATPILWTTGLVYTIPSIALFGFLVPRLGLGYRTALVALVGYTLVILVRNMVAGMEGVPATIREAATAMGFTPWRRFWSVELPLALPTIMAGIRIATVGTVGLVTISALVGEGGYGALINNGLSRQNFSTPIVVGATLSIVMALVLDLALWLTQRALTPWDRATGGSEVSTVVLALEWTGSRGLIERTIAHLELAGLSMLIALIIAVPLGILVGHTRRGGGVATSLVTAGRAVPTYAVIALLFPLAIIWGLGLGFWPSVVALVLLAIPPLYTNTYTGIRGVEPALVEAGKGVGMAGRQVLWGVEVPVALPLILAGVRTAVVQVMATATLASIFGYQALGSYLTEGLSQRDDAKLLTGTIAVGVLWLIAEALLGLLQRWLTPWARADSSRAARRRARAAGRGGPSDPSSTASIPATTSAAGAEPLPFSQIPH